jgi:GntR family transcriptional regulator
VFLSIDPADPRPLYVQIMDAVRHAAAGGALRPDDALPSVRQLATSTRVNPNTVKQAYRELEREGVIYTRRGQGTFLAAGAAVRPRKRAALLRPVAERALRDAHRMGAGAAELIAAIEALQREAEESERAAAEHTLRGSGAAAG